MRSACAFDCEAILVAGSRKNVMWFGSKGTKSHVRVEIFPSMKEVVDYVRKQGAKIYGVEIANGAKRIDAHPFDGPTAFLLGNEGDGLSKKEIALCDELVYISHYGNGTASLNVAVAASIVFHHFALWAKYGERAREGHKYVVDPVTRAQAGPVTDSERRIHEERKARREARNEEVAIGSIFS